MLTYHIACNTLDPPGTLHLVSNLERGEWNELSYQPEPSYEAKKKYKENYMVRSMQHHQCHVHVPCMSCDLKLT